MSDPATINPRIIEALYCEGLMLSDEVRGAFSMTGGDPRSPEDERRVALSCEALRTTTRMMHAVAWLLNHRAYFRGEISEFQLRRHGRLQSEFPGPDPTRMTMLDPAMQDLIAATVRFYARLVRIDTAWRRETEGPSAIERLRERLGGAVG